MHARCHIAFKALSVDDSLRDHSFPRYPEKLNDLKSPHFCRIVRRGYYSRKFLSIGFNALRRLSAIKWA